MRFLKSILLSASLLVYGTSQVQAALITTTFNSDNGGNVGGAVYFDLEVLSAAGLTFEEIYLNVGTSYTSPGSIVNLNVFSRPGTSAGFEGSSAGWSPIASGIGITALTNTPSLFDISDFFLASGMYGIALEAVDFNHAYTNGNGSNQLYSNVDLELSFGTATNVTFSNPTNDPRVANLTLQYSGGGVSAVPEPASIALLAAGVLGFGASRRKFKRK